MKNVLVRNIGISPVFIKKQGAKTIRIPNDGEIYEVNEFDYMQYSNLLNLIDPNTIMLQQQQQPIAQRVAPQQQYMSTQQVVQPYTLPNGNVLVRNSTSNAVIIKKDTGNVRIPADNDVYEISERDYYQHQHLLIRVNNNINVDDRTMNDRVVNGEIEKSTNDININMQNFRRMPPQPQPLPYSEADTHPTPVAVQQPTPQADDFRQQGMNVLANILNDTSRQVLIQEENQLLDPSEIVPKKELPKEAKVSPAKPKPSRGKKKEETGEKSETGSIKSRVLAYLAQHPEKGPTEIANDLGVKSNYVSVLKSNMKKES